MRRANRMEKNGSLFFYLNIGRDEARVVCQQQTEPSPESGELVLRTRIPNFGCRRSKVPAVASFRREFVRCKQKEWKH